MSQANLIRFALFFTTLSFLVSWLTYRLLRRRLGLTATGNRRLLFFFLGSATLMTLGPFLYRWLEVSADSTPDLILQWTQFSLLGWIGSLFIVFFFSELIQFTSQKFDPQKRIFLTEGVGRTLLAGTTLTSVAGFFEATAGAEVVGIPIQLETLPPAFEGLKIVQISDVHVGPLIHRGYLDRVVDQVLALKPDLIAITGDLVDGSVNQLRDQIAPLARLRAPEGVYFCTGNHEYYSGVHEWISHLGELGITVLGNTNRILRRPGKNGEDRLLIAGVHDHQASRFEPLHATDARKAASCVEDVSCKILLAHNPFSIDAACSSGFHLQLSGHTHAGQFYPYSFIVKAVLKHSEGLYRVSEKTQLYVNRGTGFWGPPNRFGKRAEITELTLTRSKKS
jgi:predicted MPP superfamily phosphohydrolase